MQELNQLDTTQKQPITTFFTERGYEVVSLEQPGRHIIGKLSKQNHNYFLKLATNAKLGELTKNERTWNDLMLSSTGASKLPVFIPQVFEEGEYQGNFWFCSTFIAGESLVKPGDTQINRLIFHLASIAETAKRIMFLPSDLVLPRDSEHQEILEEKLMRKIHSWAEIIPEDVTSLIAFIKSRIRYIQSAPAHGDYTPWHFMYSPQTKLTLIDAEAASMKAIKYYDLAYFYHRTYTKLYRPDIANQFLELYLRKNTLDQADKECLRLCLAQRIIGGYFDAQSDMMTDLDLQRRIHSDLLANIII